MIKKHSYNLSGIYRKIITQKASLLQTNLATYLLTMI